MGRYLVSRDSSIVTDKMLRLPASIACLERDVEVNRVASIIVPVPDLMDNAPKTTARHIDQAYEFEFMYSVSRGKNTRWLKAGSTTVAPLAVTRTLQV
jgi:hypothetical protein